MRDVGCNIQQGLPAFGRDSSTMDSEFTAYSLMSLQQDIPDDLPSWEFAEDVLGGFDQFLDVSSFSQLDEGTSAVTREQAPVAAEPAGPSVSDADELEPAQASRPSSSRSDPDGKKQRQNRQSQQRFRQRQRVSFGCTFTPVSLRSCSCSCALQTVPASHRSTYFDCLLTGKKVARIALHLIAWLAGSDGKPRSSGGPHNSSSAGVASKSKAAGSKECAS